MAASCLAVDSGAQALKEGKVASPDTPPDALEMASLEDQVMAKVNETAKKKAKAAQVENVHKMVINTALDQALESGHDILLGTPEFMVGMLRTPLDLITDTVMYVEGLKASPVSMDTSQLEQGAVIVSLTFIENTPFTYGETAKDVGRMGGIQVRGQEKTDYRRRRRSIGGRYRRSTPKDAPQQADFNGLMTVELSMNDADRLEINMTESVADVNTSMIYFTLPIDDDTVGFVLDFEPIPELYAGETLQVFTILKARQEFLYKPRQNMYDLKTSLPRNTTVNPWSFVVPEYIEKVPLAFIGVLYINASYNGTVTDDDFSGTTNGTSEEKVIVPDDMILKNASDFPFRLFTTFATCRSWDSLEEEWILGPCSLSNDTTTEVTRCGCTSFTPRISSLTSSFTPPGINTIDFSNVFGNFGALLAGNPAVFSLIIIIIVLYIFLLVWARRKDLKDIKKWTIQPLVDNRPSDTYLYHITVVTGMRQGGGTKSNVAFILSGENSDTGIRILDDQFHRGFGRGTVRRFMMTTREMLGQLTYFRLWHDSSGKGNNANWYLGNIVVEDVQTRESFYFICDQWLALDEDDCQIERVLPVAGEEQILDPKNLFFTSSRKKFTHEHLWVSVFARPECSNFTRAQRLTSGVTLLFITMVSNAMWYRTPDQAEDDAMVHIGPIVLSLDILYISVMSSLTSIPLSTIIIIFFQKARPKPLKPGQTATGMEPPPAFHKSKSELSEDEAAEVKKYKKKYPLPWWCTVIAWVLSILTILAAGFFVILYSLDWGKAKAEGWLSAFFLCFFENLFLVQPFKVVVITILLSCIFRKLDVEDKEKGSTEKSEDTQELDNDAPDSDTLTASAPILNKKALEHARFIAMRDKMVWQTLKEIVLYVVFLILVMYLAWGSRNSSDYFIRKTILGMLEKDNSEFSPIYLVSDGHKMWSWLEKTLVPNIYWQQYYNGRPTPRWARRYTNDINSVRLGTVRLRQLRVETAWCNNHIELVQCHPDYGYFASDSRDFSPGWKYILNRTDNLHSRLEWAFAFLSFFKLQNIPYLGKLNVYGGGGYVAELGNNSASALSLIKQLKKYDWVDKRTRAVLFETTIYNVNVHLFASVICLFEFPATGAVLPHISVDTFHAYGNLGVKGQVTVGLMAAFCIILIYLIVHEALKFKSDRRDYFKDPWNVVEVIFLFISFAAVGMYSSKEAYSRYITEKVHADKNANIGYMQLSTYEIGYNAITGMTTFIATIKLLRIMNFSQQVRDLATSMRLIRRDLFSYAIVFMCVYMAFSMFGLIVFGRYLKDYSTFVRSLQSLYATLLGKFDYHGLHSVHEIVGPLFLIFFAIIIVFVLVNLFIGIVTAAFEEARFDLLGAFDDEVWNHLFHKVKVFLCLEKPAVPEPVYEDESDEDDDLSEFYRPGGIPDAMKPERRAALHSLDVHLHFLNIYIDQILKKENDESDLQLEKSKVKTAAISPYVLDVDAALMGDDIPISLLEMLVKSPGYVSKKLAIAGQIHVSPSPECSNNDEHGNGEGDVLSENDVVVENNDKCSSDGENNEINDVDENLQALENEIVAIADEKAIEELGDQALEDEIAALAEQGDTQNEKCQEDSDMQDESKGNSDEKVKDEAMDDKGQQNEAEIKADPVLQEDEN